MNSYRSLQARNFLLRVLQSQENGLIRTLTSVLLQRTPRTKNARSGLPQDEQNKKIKKNNRNGQAVNPKKGVAQIHHHNGVTIQTKVSNNATRLRLPLVCSRWTLSIHSL